MIEKYAPITDVEFDKLILDLFSMKRVTLKRKKEYERIFSLAFNEGILLNEIETDISRRAIQDTISKLTYKPYSSLRMGFITKKLNQGYPISFISNKLGTSKRYGESNKIIRQHFRDLLTPRTKLKILKRDNFRCKFCGKTPNETKLHIDHIKPLSKGGGNKMDNLQTLCESCNCAKSNKEDFSMKCAIKLQGESS